MFGENGFPIFCETLNFHCRRGAAGVFGSAILHPSLRVASPASLTPHHNLSTGQPPLTMPSLTQAAVLALALLVPSASSLALLLLP